MELSSIEKYRQINTADVAELLGVSKATVWRYVNRGVLPQPHYISPKRPKWKLGEVIEVYESHLTSSENLLEGRGVATSKKEAVGKPLSTAAKLKKRFGLS